MAGSDGVACWGSNTNGQLGTATPGIAAPAIVAGTEAIPTTGGSTQTPTLLAAGGSKKAAKQLHMGLASVDNATGSAEHDVLAAGLTDTVNNTLSRLASMFVVARDAGWQRNPSALLDATAAWNSAVILWIAALVALRHRPRSAAGAAERARQLSRGASAGSA